MLVRVGRVREYTLEICRCKKYVCILWELKEYEILESVEKQQI